MKIPVRKIKEPDVKGSFRIRSIESLLEGRDMVQELHRHDFFFVLAVRKGSGKHIIDFVPYSITSNSVFIMRPGQVHELALTKNSSGYVVEFSSDFYSPSTKNEIQVFRKVSYKTHCALSAKTTSGIFDSLQLMLREYEEKHELFTEVIKAEMKVFFIKLLRQSRHPVSATAKADTYAQEKLEDFLALLNTHIATEKQVSRYAAMLHLTPFQLNAIIKETLNKTASQLISEQILLEVKRQLLATANKVNQIAADLGYEDTSYFIRFFKKHTGYSPETFRKNFK